MTLEKTKNPNSCTIALGANLPSTLGGEMQSIGYALHQFGELGLMVTHVSRFFCTPSYPNPSDPPFVNAVVKVQTVHKPHCVLNKLHQIEATLNRKRDLRWAARTLDLDLLDYDEMVLPDLTTHQAWRALRLDAQMKKSPDELILPHPRLQERAFVLVPLCDIAPQWVHPTLKQTAFALKSLLPTASFEGIYPLKVLK